MSSIGNTNRVVENIILQSLMGIRLNDHNPPPAFESEEDLVRLLMSDSDEDEDDDESASLSLARLEAKVEKDIIRLIHSDPAALNPNSGQAISVGDHQVCVSFNQEKPSDEYRVWEWHGHVMLLDDSTGYSPEYIYGNYFQRAPPNRSLNNSIKNNSGGGGGGLKDLIRNPNTKAPPRVVHRNINASSPHPNHS